MKMIWIVCKRELNTFFDSLVAYVLLILFLGFSGFFTWLFGSDIFLRGEADLKAFFQIAYWSLFFFIPAITMKSIAEEKKTGTIELLLTKSVSDFQIVAGKFLAAFVLISIALLATISYYITIANIGEVDHGMIWCGYLSLLLLSATYISIGVYTSSLTNNQIVAFLMALFIGLFFHLIFDILASNSSGWIGSMFQGLSARYHFDSLSRGVVDSKDLIYFLSIVAICLIGTEFNLSKRKITQ